jgi:GNAT superfamily N-acetyltransferase
MATPLDCGENRLQIVDDAIMLQLGVRQLVATQNDRVIGFGIDGPSRDVGVRPATGEIYALYVLPEMVGHGIGRGLLAHLVKDLKQNDYSEATLWVLDGNARARRFYEITGWSADGSHKVEERPGVTLHELRYRRALVADSETA